MGIFYLQNGVGCHSEVGYQGGKQILSLDSHCFSEGVIQHEFLHGNLSENLVYFFMIR